MATFQGVGDNDNFVGGGYGMGYGGGGVMVILVLIILFALFGGGFGFGRGRDGRDGDGCGQCVRPVFPDESNWENEVHVKDKLCMEEDKTRALITHEAERAADKDWMKTQLLLQTKDAENAQLKNVIYTNGEFGKVYARLGEINCKMLDRPPIYAEAYTPVSNRIEHGCAPCRGKLDEAFGW